MTDVKIPRFCDSIMDWKKTCLMQIHSLYEGSNLSLHGKWEMSHNEPTLYLVYYYQVYVAHVKFGRK